MIIKSSTYAKVGELLQGAFSKNEPFLVSNTSSKLLKTDTLISTISMRNEIELGVKSKRAIELFHTLIEKKGFTQLHPIYISQKRNFEKGKGLSSSSTDILGVLFTLNEFYKTPFSIQDLYKIAAQIEPTDPCLDQNSLLFNQKKGQIIEAFSTIPYVMLYFDADVPLKIDTIKLSEKRVYSEPQMKEFQTLFQVLKQSVTNRDYATFFECVTRSAVINQAILPKNKFDVLYHFALANNCGLFVAHSGTYMGLLIEPYRLESIEKEVSHLVAKHWHTKLFIE